jgi:uncharacterized protein (TIGR03435 family)
VLFSLLGALAQFCRGQSISSTSHTFIAAAIKPSDPNRSQDEGDIEFSPGGSFDAKIVTLKDLIEFVYYLRVYDVDQRIIGGPKWLSSAKFDIEAKCDDETARTFEKIHLKDQVRTEQTMIQALLVDRFQLKTHHETRLLPVYALVLATGKSRMKPSADANTDQDGLDEEPDGPNGNWRADGVTMQSLADTLSSLSEIGGRIVVDKTGLKGAFDFTLKWTPDPTAGVAPPGPDSGAKSDPSAPSLLAALQEQLGLKLQSAKEPVDVIVIDSAELPSPN